MTEINISPVTLQDDNVMLLPMSIKNINGLFEAGKHPSIWCYTTHAYCLTKEATRAWVSDCLHKAALGMLVPFVIVDQHSKQIVGASCYLNIALAHKAIEIGFTFLTPSAQATYVNKCCKLLLLAHAFDTLDVNRVAFQTHEKNTPSKKAILSLGASFEGVHRQCRIQHDGSVRSSAFYSIIRDEWPVIKTNLQRKVDVYTSCQ